MAEQVDPALQIRIDAINARNAAMAGRLPKFAMIKVHPRDDDVRRVLKHYPTGVGFPKEGPAEWPHDKFTNRRLMEGSVTREEGGGRAQRSTLQHQQHRS
jgi:hypothetical protein